MRIASKNRLLDGVDRKSTIRRDDKVSFGGRIRTQRQPGSSGNITADEFRALHQLGILGSFVRRWTANPIPANQKHRPSRFRDSSGY
jgi:hypothetical protein